MVSHYGTLFGKALYVFRFAAQERFRDKEREIGVLYSLFFKTTVQFVLDSLSDGVAVRLDNHTASYCRLFGKVSFYHQFVIPFGIVFLT